MLLFIQIYSLRQALYSADNILIHTRGQGGRGNLGEEGRGEARLQAASGCSPHTSLPFLLTAYGCSQPSGSLDSVKHQCLTCRHIHTHAQAQTSAETDELFIYVKTKKYSSIVISAHLLLDLSDVGFRFGKTEKCMNELKAEVWRKPIKTQTLWTECPGLKSTYYCGKSLTLPLIIM